MPGYDRKRFVGLGQREAEELECRICFEILDNPVITRCCRQAFCRDCISEWLAISRTCPYDRAALDERDLRRSRRLAVAVSRLRTRCGYRRFGCEASVEFGELARHQKGCEFAPGRQQLLDALRDGSDRSCLEWLSESLDDEIRKMKIKDNARNIRATKMLRELNIDIRIN